MAPAQLPPSRLELQSWVLSTFQLKPKERKKKIVDVAPFLQIHFHSFKPAFVSFKCDFPNPVVKLGLGSPRALKGELSPVRMTLFVWFRLRRFGTKKNDHQAES